MAGTVETLLLVALSLLATEVKGHGRLMEPPARNVMWRFGYNTHVNYEDNMLHCGGFNVSTCLKKLSLEPKDHNVIWPEHELW